MRFASRTFRRRQGTTKKAKTRRAKQRRQRTRRSKRFFGGFSKPSQDLYNLYPNNAKTQPLPHTDLPDAAMPEEPVSME